MVAGLVLAAGFSRRFGSDKRCARLRSGQTLLGASLVLPCAQLEDVWVVLRPEDNSAALGVPVHAVVVRSESPYKTLDELLRAAKAEPNKITYGTGGAGTMPHFASEALGIATGVNFMHIPFKGAGEATTAILSNTIDMQIASTTGLMGNVKGGKMRIVPLLPVVAEAVQIYRKLCPYHLEKGAPLFRGARGGPHSAMSTQTNRWSVACSQSAPVSPSNGQNTPLSLTVNPTEGST